LTGPAFASPSNDLEIPLGLRLRCSPGSLVVIQKPPPESLHPVDRGVGVSSEILDRLRLHARAVLGRLDEVHETCDGVLESLTETGVDDVTVLVLV
jgi:hypothetical protein